MSIKYSILGLLSWKPLSGYDLKKYFSESVVMYWSGNNNQIYKTLVQLLNEELVTTKVIHSENSPMKKVYTVTEKGVSELRKWTLTAPEPPELRNTFLLQLAWADQLDVNELEELVTRYEKEVELQLIMQKEKIRRRIDTPDRTIRERYLWDMIADNIVSHYESEYAWAKRVHSGLMQQNFDK